MKRFKTKKNYKIRWVLYLGVFLVSVGFSIKFIFRENIVNENAFLDVLVDDLFVSKNHNVLDVDFLFKYVFNTNIKEIESFKNVYGKCKRKKS